jgi:hypothetical protein
MRATILVLLKGGARTLLLCGGVLVFVVLPLPLLWGMLSATVGGIATVFVRDRVFPRFHPATVVGEIATMTIVLVIAVVRGFSSDTYELQRNGMQRNGDLLGVIFITVTIGAEGMFRKRDCRPDASEGERSSTR